MESRRVTLGGVELFAEFAADGVDQPVLQSVDGLIDGPLWAAASGDRALSDGSWSGAQRRRARSGSLSGVTVSPDPLASEAWMERLSAATAGKDVACVFHFASGPRTLLVRVDGAIKWRRRLMRAAEWQIPLVADDPLVYLGDGVTPGWTGSTGRASEAGGLTFPLEFPFLWDSSVTGGVIGFANRGTAGRLQMRIDGPVTDPRVTVRNADGVRVLAWEGLVLGEGQYLFVDVAQRRALLQGQASRPPSLRGWPRLAPGAHEFGFHASGSSTGVLTVWAWPAI